MTTSRTHVVIELLCLSVATLALIALIVVLMRSSSGEAMYMPTDLPTDFPPPPALSSNLPSAVAQAIANGYLKIEQTSEPTAEGIVTVDAAVLGRRCKVEVLLPPDLQGVPMPYTPMSAVCG